MIADPRDAMAMSLDKGDFPREKRDGHRPRDALVMGLKCDNCRPRKSDVLGERRDSHGPRNAMAMGLEKGRISPRET